MDANLKKTLQVMTYYTLIGVMLAFEIYFMITLAGASLANWERVVYYILAIALLIAVVYDIICTIMHRQKYISGFIIYVISITVVVISLIIFALNSANGRLLIEISEKFFRLILFSYIINGLTIAIYCTGEKLINTVQNRAKK